VIRFISAVMLDEGFAQGTIAVVVAASTHEDVSARCAKELIAALSTTQLVAARPTHI